MDPSVGDHSIEVMAERCHWKVAAALGRAKPFVSRGQVTKVRRSQILKVPSSWPEARRWSADLEVVELLVFLASFFNNNKKNER